ncbi:hypothetical protein J6590_062713 [Homalodisca vitripennis]|nr:hypothetical protein J6590_062713 [Homalodisca vitripennis]
MPPAHVTLYHLAYAGRHASRARSPTKSRGLWCIPNTFRAPSSRGQTVRLLPSHRTLPVQMKLRCNQLKSGSQTTHSFSDMFSVHVRRP